MTAEVLSHLPEDGFRYELVRGQLVRDSPAGSRHGAIAHHLGRLLGIWAQQEHSGVVFAAETGYKLRTDPDTVRAPDVSFVARDRIPAEGLPDGSHQDVRVLTEADDLVGEDPVGGFRCRLRDVFVEK